MDHFKNDAAAIERILTEMQGRTKRAYGIAFGENAANVNPDVKKNIVKNLNNIIFTPELAKAKGESSVATNAGLNSNLHATLVADMQREFEERAESAIGAAESYFNDIASAGATAGSIASQQYGLWGSNLPNTSQLLLIALAPSVIKPIYNKLLKSIVVKGVFIDRIMDIPYIINSEGKTLNLYDALNSPTLLKGFNDGGQPTIQIEVPIENNTAKTAYTNLINVYNREGAVKDPANFKSLKNASDFIARGVKIVGAKIDDQVYTGDLWVSSGLNAQSGQADDEVATISLDLGKKDGTGDLVRILGSLKASGDLLLYSNSSNLKSLTFEFFMPAKGVIDPIRIVPRKTHLRYYMRKHATGSITLNPKFLEDGQFILGKDLVNEFQEQAIATASSQIESYVLDKLDTMITEGAARESAGNSVYINMNAASFTRSKFGYKYVNMSNEDYGYTDVVTGHSKILALRLYDVMNSIDRTLNPNVKNFAIVSNSLAARWVCESDKSNLSSFNYIGESLDNVAGISIPYEVKAITVNNAYYGSYMVTNKLKPEETLLQTKNTNGDSITAKTNSHRYYINARFEENLDTNVLVHGFERVYKIVNDVEFYKDFALGYEKNYDMFTFNPTIAALDFVEKSGATSATILK